MVDIAFEARAFLVALVPLAAERAALHAARPVAILVQLVIDDNVIHLLVLDLVINVHQDDIGFDIFGALAVEFHFLVRLQKRLLHVEVDGIGNLALAELVKHLFRRNNDNLVSLLDGVAQLVAHVVEALLHVDMHRVGTARNEVHADAHVPCGSIALGALQELAERILADTVDEHDLRIEFRHERAFLVHRASEAPEVRIQAKHLGKGLVAIEGREQRIVAGILLLQEFGILRRHVHVAEAVARLRSGERPRQGSKKEGERYKKCRINSSFHTGLKIQNSIRTGTTGHRFPYGLYHKWQNHLLQKRISPKDTSKMQI